ncbi:DUF4238 domain-containing protein [Vibrio parahaemolyticus]
MQTSYRHHYVPEWYQRRFMLDGQKSYFRLDLSPEEIVRPDGQSVKIGEILNKGPTRFFYEVDLYTTQWFGEKNDEIERHLFGHIDSSGSKALSALASEEWMREIHPHVTNIFEYMDAQRIRTPKGLEWLTRVTRAKTHNELLLRMQELRRMHCTMWAEASLEVVSANESETKFIVSDNPVTLYNSVFYPGNEQCRFPNDPGIHLKGTRTIFPTDLNHCVILTNKEFARSPGKFKAPKPRTNARYFDQTIINYSDFIREREFSEQQVIVVNHILKSRAHKYIAAAKKEWLYPEKYLKKKDWGKLDKVFVSKSTKLLGRDSEIFIGGEGGKLMATQDEFGCRPQSSGEWKAKEQQMQKMHADLMRLLAKEKSNKAFKSDS